MVARRHRCAQPHDQLSILLDGGGSGYRFVNGTGVHARTVADAADFRLSAYAPPPAWLADAVFYEVLPGSLRFLRGAP